MSPSVTIKTTSALAMLVAASGLFHTGLDHYAKGQFADAAKLFERVVRDCPNTSVTDDAQYWLGRALWKTGRVDDARHAFQAVVDQHPHGDMVLAARVGLAFLGGAWKGLDLTRVGPWDQVVCSSPQGAVASYFLAGRQGDVTHMMACLTKSAQARLQAGRPSADTPTGHARLAARIRNTFARWQRFQVGAVHQFAGDKTQAIVDVVYTGADHKSAVRPTRVAKENGRWVLTSNL